MFFVRSASFISRCNWIESYQGWEERRGKHFLLFFDPLFVTWTLEMKAETIISRYQVFDTHFSKSNHCLHSTRIQSARQNCRRATTFRNAMRRWSEGQGVFSKFLSDLQKNGQSSSHTGTPRAAGRDCSFSGERPVPCSLQLIEEQLIRGARRQGACSKFPAGKGRL